MTSFLNLVGVRLALLLICCYSLGYGVLSGLLCGAVAYFAAYDIRNWKAWLLAFVHLIFILHFL